MGTMAFEGGLRLEGLTALKPQQPQIDSRKASRASR